MLNKSQYPPSAAELISIALLQFCMNKQICDLHVWMTDPKSDHYTLLELRLWVRQSSTSILDLISFNFLYDGKRKKKKSFNDTYQRFTREK